LVEAEYESLHLRHEHRTLTAEHQRRVTRLFWSYLLL